MQHLVNSKEKGQNKKGIPSLVPITTKDFSNESLYAYFQNSWVLSDLLYKSITKNGAMYIAPDQLRLPLIFYLGHAAVFYINLLKKSGIIKKGINQRYEKLFARGVDPEFTEELNSYVPWPKENDVWLYRKQAFEIISEIIQKNKINNITIEDPLWSLFMGIEHDRIHFETSSVLIRQYPTTFLTKPEGWEYAPIDNTYTVSSKMILVSAGNVQIGKPLSFPTFGWDNEYGSLEVRTNPFYARNNLISNEEFKEFVLDGGYNEKSFWTEDGWEWKTQNNVKHPKFWVHKDDQFLYRAMFDIIEFPINWPAEVNFHEAKAYCAWKGHNTRLLTEPEFERLAQEVSLYTQQDVFSCSQYNLNLKYGSPCSVDSICKSNQSTEFNDIYGNVWQWLDNVFYPLPGFKTHYLYEDFSYPFFTPKHVMLKGGSWASTGTSASKFYRLWFRKNCFQHFGFRLAQNA